MGKSKPAKAAGGATRQGDGLAFIRPDWRDQQNYEWSDKTLVQFAWEFLRRNPDYEADWSEYLKELRAIALAVPSDQELQAFVKAYSGTGAEWAAWRAECSETDSFMLRLYDAPGFIVNAGGHRRVPLPRRFGEKWGLAWLLNPALDDLYLGFADFGACMKVSEATRRELDDETPTDEPAFTKGRYLLLRVDLMQPITVIREHIIGEINLERAFRTRRGDLVPIDNRARRDKYIEYLRILDGLAVGASLHEIGECLAPGANNLPPDRPRDKRFEKAAEEARRLQNGGYRALVVLIDSALPKIGLSSKFSG